MENARISTYRAYFEADNREIYHGERHGNLVGLLPCGAWPTDGGTLERKDGGDPYERARFSLPSGRFVIVEREPFQACSCTRRGAFACAENAYDRTARTALPECRRCITGSCKGKHGIKAGTVLSDGSVSQ